MWTKLPTDFSIDPVLAEHDGEGRIIMAEYATLMVLHTYTPNNGDALNGSRREWDVRIREWFGSSAVQNGKPVIYCGDLNVAPFPIDLTSPSKFARPSAGFGIPKFKEKMEPEDRPDDIGQPGCTPAEQNRFAQLLENGKLVDAYRAKNPPAAGAGLDDALPKEEHKEHTFTWRGPESGPYYKEGMRIDHFLCSEALMPRVETVTIEGKGLSCADDSFFNPNGTC